MKTLKLGGVLIALYVVVTNADNVGAIFGKAATGASTFVRVLQGRTNPATSAPPGRAPR